MNTVAVALAVIFAGLAALHLYWAAGGRLGFEAAIPKDARGNPLFTPGPAAAFVVALGLIAFGYVCLARCSLVPIPFSNNASGWIVRGISGIFALRAIGDFHHVGITRRVTRTVFSRRDRLLYTPLCFLLALGLLALGLFGKTPDPG